MARLRFCGGLLLMALAVRGALAQTAAPTPAITATPLAPPPGVTGQPLSAPTLAPATPGQPADTTTPQAAPAAPAPADTTAPQTYTPAPPVPEQWQPAANAVLQVLDKVDAQSAELTVKVGGSVQYRSLTIAVRACDASTKDEKADATAFLDITDSHADQPSFHGWMLKSDPSVSMLQHPIYDVRVLACHA
jgi:hypothetical protein